MTMSGPNGRPAVDVAPVARPARPPVTRTSAVLLAVAAGAVWALAAPTRGWWPLLPLGVAALAIALRGRSPWGRLLLGALAGVALHAPSLRWLTDFSVPGYVAMVVLEAAMLAVAAAIVPASSAGRWSGGWWALPAALVALEAVQNRFPLNGFPLVGMSLSQLDGPFAQAAPLGGGLLVTALAATSGIALAALVVVPGRGRRLAAAGAAVAVAAVPLVAAAGVATRPGETLDVAVVQGGGPRGVRAVFTDPAEVTERHLAVLRGIGGTPDLVVLPENVVSVEGSVQGSPVGEALAAQARRLQTHLVVGVVETERDRFRNAAVLWGPDGTVLGRYEKQHRVPFGEYIPGRELLERFTDATALVPRDAIVGRGEALLPSAHGPLGVVISFEVFFADRVRDAVTAGGGLVLVPTNAASYVTEEVPALEVAAARLRAREVDRSVVQAAPTGYSAVVRPDGEVVARSELGAAAVLREQVQLRSGPTPYARTGDLPVLALAVGALVAGPVLRGSRPRR